MRCTEYLACHLTVAGHHEGRRIRFPKPATPGSSQLPHVHVPSSQVQAARSTGCVHIVARTVAYTATLTQQLVTAADDSRGSRNDE
jgi:hypothetical protein|eukprot:SAG25_NODE_2219_length_1828_cov_1.128976_1_plen_86_part_00